LVLPHAGLVGLRIAGGDGPAVRVGEVEAVCSILVHPY